MARPLSPSDSYRNGSSGGYQPRYSLDDSAPSIDPAEFDRLNSENLQLRQLCADLEQALAEATQNSLDPVAVEQRIREYESLLEAKDETIRLQHVELQEIRAAAEETASKGPAKRSGPLPREDELLTLSEELERERKQLVEDEETLMEQMRQMEMGMARERAEMARQRNDLQRLAGEVRHEMERLERNGALQNKMEDLRAKLQDATSRRGAAPASAARPSSSNALPPVNAQEAAQTPPAGQSRGSFMGRFFGGGNSGK